MDNLLYGFYLTYRTPNISLNRENTGSDYGFSNT